MNIFFKIKTLALVILAVCLTESKAQEFKVNVSIMSDKISSVDPKVFRTLQTSLQNFLNSQKWTELNFKEYEKIECNFIVTPLQVMDEKSTVFKGNLSISASRPVYGTSYKTPIFNYIDRNFTFKYIEFQPIQYNELQISGGDPLVDNLVAQFAFYSYAVLGLYFDSFSPNGGEKYYNKARNVVNNAPKNGSISGWDGSSNNKNSRYWFIDDLQNPRMKNFHPIWYTYHRDLMDRLTSQESKEAYKNLNTVVNDFSKLYVGNASSKLVEFFISTKGNEIYDLIASDPNEEDISSLASKMAKMHIVKYKDYQKLINGQ